MQRTKRPLFARLEINWFLLRDFPPPNPTKGNALLRLLPMVSLIFDACVKVIDIFQMGRKFGVLPLRGRERVAAIRSSTVGFSFHTLV